ncbi:unnamed protein product, partial [Laminaria digitata]
ASPSAFHYTAAVKACGAAKQGDQVIALLSEMEGHGLTPDVSCYNAAIKAAAAGGMRTHTR